MTPAVKAYVARISPLSVNPAPMVRGNGPEQFHRDWSARLSGLQAPTLVLVGRYDFTQPVYMSEELARLIPDARLAILEESGHFPWVEERECFRAVVGDFAQNL